MGTSQFMYVCMYLFIYLFIYLFQLQMCWKYQGAHK